jgi:hypothetical protein
MKQRRGSARARTKPCERIGNPEVMLVLNSEKQLQPWMAHSATRRAGKCNGGSLVSVDERQFE